MRFYIAIFLVNPSIIPNLTTMKLFFFSFSILYFLFFCVVDKLIIENQCPPCKTLLTFQMVKVKQKKTRFFNHCFPPSIPQDPSNDFCFFSSGIADVLSSYNYFRSYGLHNPMVDLFCKDDEFCLQSSLFNPQNQSFPAPSCSLSLLSCS